MGHKTITISEDAYEALVRNRRDNESFTKAILRLTSEKSKVTSLLAHLRNTPPDEELATAVEDVMGLARKARLNPANLSR